MAADPTWNFLEAASKGRIIETLTRQASALFELADDPAHWQVATACEGWELRDMIGHLVDAIESSLTGFALARSGGDPPLPSAWRAWRRRPTRPLGRSVRFRARSCSPVYGARPMTS